MSATDSCCGVRSARAARRARRRRTVRSCSSSASAEIVSGSVTVKARHPGGRTLADLDGGFDARREVGVNPGAEADQADPLALLHLSPGLQVGDDAAGDRAGDLHHLDVADLGVEVPDDALVAV